MPLPVNKNMKKTIKNKYANDCLGQSLDQCLGVVLAGGLSSRMGENKASLMRNNTSMLDYSKQLLTRLDIKNIVISGNDYDIPDLFPNLGPMSGIYSVIKSYRPKALLILPVDLPLMNTESLAQLKQIGELSHKAVYFEDNFLPLYLPVTAHVEQFFDQQLLSLNKVSADTSIASDTNISANNKMTKGPSMKALLKQTPSQAIKPKNINSLFNSNTPQEWRHAQTQFSTRK